MTDLASQVNSPETRALANLVAKTENRLQLFAPGGCFIARTCEEPARWVAVYELLRAPSGDRRCLARGGESPAAALTALEGAVAELAAALRGGLVN